MKIVGVTRDRINASPRDTPGSALRRRNYTPPCRGLRDVRPAMMFDVDVLLPRGCSDIIRPPSRRRRESERNKRADGIAAGA